MLVTTPPKDGLPYRAIRNVDILNERHVRQLGVGNLTYPGPRLARRPNMAIVRLREPGYYGVRKQT